ncbi:MAG TPA: histidine triad nucleotide-binding protein [Planctomycetota bacterium]|nr:histidine triad nucleotide-binding protein [Planctomycetota bacterium]
MDCIFCKIAAGQIPAKKVFEDGEIVAFRDINPVAPTHVLIIPREHIETINDLEPGHAAIVGRLHLAARELARQEGLAERGYRLVFNCGPEAGQAVFHIHLHLIGGRKLSWPPG